MLVFVLVGLPSSGKTSHGTRLMELMNIPLLETGHAVYYELRKHQLDATHENTTRIIQQCLSQDPTYFLKKILQQDFHRYDGKSALLISGVKSPNETKYLREKFGATNVIIIGFHATQKTRFLRIKNQSRHDSSRFQEKDMEDNDLSQWQNFVDRDMREIKLGIGYNLALANEIIVTENCVWPFHSFEQSFKKFLSCVNRYLSD
ncbi:MAG: hypothetical protein ACTSYD_07920 [Candidatus Heimdallarchaeaceae archaeon]